MSRYRKVTAIDIQERKKILREKNMFRPPGLFFPPGRSVSPLNTQNRSPQEILLGVCSDVKGICKNVKIFTQEMDNLLNSVENILPVVDSVMVGYARSFKNKDSSVINMKQEVKESSPNPEEENTTNPKHPDTPPRIPSEEELKNFLNNPLIISLMQTLTQKIKPQ